MPESKFAGRIMINQKKLLKSAEPEMIEVNQANVKGIQYDEIVAVAWADEGAMGEGGRLTVAQRKNDDLQFYHTNLVHGGDEHLIDVVENTYFKPFADKLAETDWSVVDLSGWARFNMGYGHYLYIRETCAREFATLCLAIEFAPTIHPVDLYKNHQALINLCFNPKFNQEKAQLLLRKPTLLGGVIGDIVGSRFEFKPVKTKQFPLFYSYSGVPYSENQTVKDYMESSHFSDDTILTLAIAKSLLDADGKYENLRERVVNNLKDFGHRYPCRGYGARFDDWLRRKSPEPYHSYGNGAAMRVSAVPYFCDNLQQVADLSRAVTEVTHNHPEGIKGAEATAAAIWMALHNYTKDAIKQKIEQNYYKLDFDYQDLVKHYRHVESCQDSVPQSIYAFLISESYEDAIRIAVSMGGDADTMACIAGAIAGAYYGIPDNIQEEALKFLPDEFKTMITKFENYFINSSFLLCGEDVF